MSAAALLEALVIQAILVPAVLLAALGVPLVAGRPLREKVVGWLTGTSMMLCFASLLSALGAYVAAGSRPRTLVAGTWFASGPSHEGAFRFDFLLDGTSLGFAMLSVGICGVVAAFSHRYLHREAGYSRYFVLFASFVLGILLVALAGSIEVLFAGWELLGLSSALLVGFFHERRAPVANALRVFTVYRASDAAMLAAAVLLHHMAGSGSLSLLFAEAPPGTLSGVELTIIGVLLIAAVAGKSALFPLSGWLPRAMEGPTPSSAVYYGALSVHAGCFLLLRAGPLLEQSVTVRVLAGAAGAATAVYATICARVQIDVKSALAYASLTQVGLIVVEIALGLYTLAFIHIIGNASLRLLQFLSAPSLLHDLHELEGATKGRTRRGRRGGPAGPWRRRLYLAAIERGFLDELLDRWVVGPFRRAALAFDRLDRALAGEWRGRRRPGATREREGRP